MGFRSPVSMGTPPISTALPTTRHTSSSYLSLHLSIITWHQADQSITKFPTIPMVLLLLTGKKMIIVKLSSILHLPTGRFFHEQLLYKYSYYVKGCPPFCKQNTRSKTRQEMCYEQMGRPCCSTALRFSEQATFFHTSQKPWRNGYRLSAQQWPQRKTILQSKAPLTQDPNTQRTFYKWDNCFTIFNGLLSSWLWPREMEAGNTEMWVHGFHKSVVSNRFWCLTEDLSNII